jgi:hypothetical protein
MEHARDERHELDAEAEDRRASERRHGDRRSDMSLGGRRQAVDRRHRNRRLQLAGAGLLGALAFAVGARQMADSRIGILPDGSIGWSQPEATVDVTEGEFRVPEWNKETLEPIIQEAAALHGLPAALIRAVIQTESQFKPDAVSRVGAQGLMQIMPKTARHLGIDDPLDPRQNVLGGTKYLSTLLQRFKGNTARALAAYNAGPTVVSRYRGIPPYRETQGYVRKIHKLVDDTDAEFALPVAKARKASLRSKARSAKVRRAAVAKKKSTARSKIAARKASSRKASVRKTTVKRTSVRKAPARTSRARARRG